MLYVLRNGCPWRLLPKEFPAWQTVYWYFRRWQREGAWEALLHSLRKERRAQIGRDPDPSAVVIDSQSIKTRAVQGPEKGSDGGEKIWGRKRHLLVDTQGHLQAVKVTAANCSDLAGAKLLLTALGPLLTRVRHMSGDSHYGGTLIAWVREHLGWTVQAVRPPRLPEVSHLTPAQIMAQWDHLFPPPSRLRGGVGWSSAPWPG
jgi:putative transposase